MIKLKVKELAESQGLNISDLHLKANMTNPGAKISYPTIHNMWHNKTQPDLRTLFTVARTLGVGIHELAVEEDGDNKRPALAAA